MPAYWPTSILKSSCATVERRQYFLSPSLQCILFFQGLRLEDFYFNIKFHRVKIKRWKLSWQVCLSLRLIKKKTKNTWPSEEKYHHTLSYENISTRVYIFFCFRNYGTRWMYMIDVYRQDSHHIVSFILCKKKTLSDENLCKTISIYINYIHSACLMIIEQNWAMVKILRKNCNKGDNFCIRFLPYPIFIVPWFCSVTWINISLEGFFIIMLHSAFFYVIISFKCSVSL